MRPPSGGTESDWLSYCAQLSNTSAIQEDLLAALTAALLEHPPSVRLNFNLGVAYQRLGDKAAARTAWERLLAFEPSHTKAHRNLAELALLRNEASLAGKHAQQALQASQISQPPYGDLRDWLLVGHCLLACGESDHAVAWFQQALQHATQQHSSASLSIHADLEKGLRKARLIAWRAQGDIQSLTGWDSAAWLTDWAEEQEKLYAGTPWDAPVAAQHLEVQALLALYQHLSQRHKACDWREFDTLRTVVRRLASLAGKNPSIGLPRALAWDALHIGLPLKSLQVLAQAACQHIQTIHRPQALWTPERGWHAHARLRVAYVSYNFAYHPTSQLIHQILRDHDRSRVEVIAYALNADDNSAMRQTIRQSVDAFIDLHDHTPEAVARRIHADEIDVLIGLGGHSYGAVVDVCLWRPAPVQINYLSFCATVGAGDAFDAHIGDPVSTPIEHAPWYDEALLQLPTGHYGYNDERPIPAPTSRASLGLPEQALVLGGFNNSYKIEPETFNAWCEIMQQLPNSVLWLYTVHDEQAHFLKEAAIQRGVHPDRLFFATTVDPDAHMARLGCIDLYLDTFIYNAHTTMLDVLFAGVPAVALLGNTMVSRLASSYLLELGLDDCVANSTTAFVERAVALAQDADRRQAIREHLLSSRQKRLPFCSKQRAHALEGAYQQLWDQKRSEQSLAQ